MIASTWKPAGAAALAACVFALLVAGSGRTAGAAAGGRGAALCSAYSGLPEGFASSRLAGMVRIPAGSVRLGSLNGYPDERPTGEASRARSRAGSRG